jgi:glycosyltransferase involved in cell wall biosynthesis
LKSRIAIVSTHPIQYNAPLFALLAKKVEIDVMVFYTWGETSMGQKWDPDFGKSIEWDIPLLEGYNYHFTRNISKKPGSDHFKGIINPDLIQEIKDFNPNVIWVWGWSFHSHLKVMRYFKGKIPIWFRGDSILGENKKGFKTAARKLALTWIYKYIDKAFYVGQRNKEYYLEFGLNDSQLIKAYHSVDNDRFSAFTANGEVALKNLKRNLDIKDNDFVILYAGKLEPRKNPSFLSDLGKRIEKDKIKLVIVGNGPLETQLKSELEKSENVQFMDFQNQTQMPFIYRLADLYLLPSLSETWGLGMNEALASGTTVAASKYCGGAIDLINENNGFIFDPRDGVDTFINKLYIFRDLPKVDFHYEFLQTFNYDHIVDAVVQELF